MKEPATVAVPEPVAQSKKPDETSNFKQQRLPAWQPAVDPRFVAGCFFIIAAIFVPLGAVIVVFSDDIIEASQRYDQLVDSSCNPCNVSFTIDVPKLMNPPVYMYYQLENFYQNNRRYVKSKNDPQLSGDLGATITSDCDPFSSPGQYQSPPAGLQPIKIVAGLLDAAQPVVVDPTSVNYLPCGLIAWSKFNDSFALYLGNPPNTTAPVCDGGNFKATGEPITPVGTQFCTKTGIAWPSDLGNRYVAPATPYRVGNSKPLYLGSGGWQIVGGANTSEPFCYSECVANGWYLGERGHAIPDPRDEDLIVWMRVSPLANLRKLYRVINTAIPVGTHTVVVNYRFPVSSYKGKKTVVLSTTNWMGGQNYLLGGLYMATGILSFILGAAFSFKHYNTARRVAL